jgi:hypothetical protein
MKLLLVLAALSSLPAVAGVEKLGKYQQYRVQQSGDRSVVVKLSTTFETFDSCNHFSASGSFRAVESPAGSRSMVQEFVADFGVAGTEMACPRAKSPRGIKLESKAFEIKPAFGSVYALILVPANWELEVVE